MINNRNDENYIYEVISKNIKKYRKLNNMTQQDLADKTFYSFSFISGIESSYPQTFSIGSLYSISRALNVDFYKLCIDEENDVKDKYIIYKCNKCKAQIKIPIEIVKHYKEIYEIVDNKKVPSFNCVKCDGKMTTTEAYKL